LRPLRQRPSGEGEEGGAESFPLADGRGGSVDRIIDHLKLRFVAEKPPPSHDFQQVALMAAEEQAEYF